MPQMSAHLWPEIILDNASDPIIILDRERIIRYANVAAARMADKQVPEDLLNTSYDDILQQNIIYDEHGTVPAPESMPTYLAFTEGIETRNKLIERVHNGAHSSGLGRGSEFSITLPLTVVAPA